LTCSKIRETHPKTTRNNSIKTKTLNNSKRTLMIGTKNQVRKKMKGKASRDQRRLPKRMKCRMTLLQRRPSRKRKLP